LISSNAHLGILLEGCRNNDRASQKQLYELLNGFACKVCSTYSNNYNLQDIVHEGFIKLFKNIHQFDENRHEDKLATLKGWFKKILINTCIDHFRKSATYNISAISKQAEEFADCSSNAFDMLSYKDILNAISELTPAYRSVFNLFVIEGMSHEEIASQLGISIGSSKSNLSKAREKLRSILAKKAEWKMHNDNYKIAAS